MKICSEFECGKKAVGRGLCTGHYGQYIKGKPLTPLRSRTRTDVRNSNGDKLCPSCGVWQSTGNFWKNTKNTTRDGLNSVCNECERGRMLQRVYNITIEQYNELLTKQNGRCAICNRLPEQMSLAVDHDHKCCPDKKKSCGNCIRGLLCGSCNGAIGMLQESPIVFATALEYLGGDSNDSTNA